MKKLIHSLLGMLVVLSVGYYFYRTAGGQAPATYYADYLPRQTTATLRLDSINEIADAFAASPLGHLFSRQTMHRILDDLQAGPEAVQKYDRFHDGVVSLFTDPSFRTFLGDDMVLALLPLDREKIAREPVDELRRSLVLMATSAASGSLDTFARLVMSRSLSTEQVAGRELTRVELDTGEVVYGYVDGKVVLLALDPRPLLTCLEVREATSQEVSLQASPLFGNSRRFWAESASRKPYLRFHVNVDTIHRYLAGQEDERFQEAARYLQGLTSGSYIVFAGKGRLLLASRLHWNLDELDESARRLYNPEGQDSISLHLFGPRSLFYFWAPSLGLAQLSGDPLVTGQEEYQKMDQVLQQELGASIAELATVFGPQYGLVLEDIVNAGFFPLPRMAVFWQVRDRERAAAIVDRLRGLIGRRAAVQEKQAQVDGKTIYFWPFLPGEATQLALLLDEDMVLLANSSKDLRNMVGQDRSGAAPLSFAMDREVREELLRAEHGAAVLRPARLAARLREPLDWVAGVVEASRNISLQGLNQEILALLGGLEIVSATTDITPVHLDSRITVVPVAR